MHHWLIVAAALGVGSACASSPRAASLAPRVGLAVAAHSSRRNVMAEAESRGGRSWSGSARITLAFTGLPLRSIPTHSPTHAPAGRGFEAPRVCADAFLCDWERRARDAAWAELAGGLR